MLATLAHALSENAGPDLVPAALFRFRRVRPHAADRRVHEQDLRLDCAERPRSLAGFWPAPSGRVFDAWSRLESAEFLRQSRIIADAWSKGRRAKTRYEAIADKNHFNGPRCTRRSAERHRRTIGGAGEDASIGWVSRLTKSARL